MNTRDEAKGKACLQEAKVLNLGPPGLLPRPSLSILCRQPLILEDSSSSFPFELGHQFIAASLQYMTAGPGAASKNAVPERHVRTTPDACGR